MATGDLQIDLQIQDPAQQGFSVERLARVSTWLKSGPGRVLPSTCRVQCLGRYRCRTQVFTSLLKIINALHRCMPL